MYFPDLLAEYKQLFKKMKSEGMTSGDIYNEIKQAIEWMETTYDPAEYRAATRVDAYTMDPYLMQSYVSYLNSDDEMLLPDFLQVVRADITSRWMPGETDRVIADKFIKAHFKNINSATSKARKKKQVILKALKGLTDNEKAVFIAIRSEKMKYRQVASMLGVTRGTVQCYLKRAEKKIQLNIEQQEGQSDKLKAIA